MTAHETASQKALWNCSKEVRWRGESQHIHDSGKRDKCNQGPISIKRAASHEEHMCYLIVLVLF